MKAIVSLLIGYVLGCLNPAAILSRKKDIDLRSTGTRNLGASNALLVLGKASGALVMAVDIAKALLAARLTRQLFPKLAAAQLLGGLGAIVGHVYPAQLNFKGGKGLAAFGGMVLAYDAKIFFALLMVGLVLMFLFDHSCAMPMSAAVLFPVLAGFKSRSLTVVLIATCSSALIIIKHWSNLQRAINGEDTTVRQLAASIFSK